MTVVESPAYSPTGEGFLHEIGLYGTDEQFRDLIVPFATGGLDAGEPVVFAYDPYKVALLHRWLPDDPSITYVTDAGPYLTPARALSSWRAVIVDLLRRGARRVRIAGNVPHPGYGRPYAGWDRYEAGVDRALGDLPVWAPCLYDTRIAPHDVIDTALKLHRYQLEADARRSNDEFMAPEQLGDFLCPDPDPLERTAPQLELRDPSPREVRHALARLVTGLVTPEQLDDLVLAASEAATNAAVHGSAPVRVRAWTGADRIVVSVHDSGRGPKDPLAGLLPGDLHNPSGRGLWISHLLSLDVALRVEPDGFTVLLTCDLAGGTASGIA